MLTQVRWLLAATVVLSSSLLTAAPVPLTSRQQAQAAIVELANHLDAKDLANRAKKIVQEHDSCDISSIFQNKRGLSIGKVTELTMRDSIEVMFNQLAVRKNVTEADLEKYHDDLNRVARVMQAMAEIAPYRGEDFIAKENVKRLEAWAQTSAEFKVKALAFRKAVDEKDPKQVRITAMAMTQACASCHLVRDQ